MPQRRTASSQWARVSSAPPSAYHLAKRGAQVTILEQIRPGIGATQNSFAWLNASRRPRPYYELNLMGIMGWWRLGLEIGSELQIQ